VFVLSWFGEPGLAISAMPCSSLAALGLPDTTITLAQEVTAGTVTVAVPPAFTPRIIGGLPPFCRVAGVIKPTSDSNISFEVWLPLANWNGRFAGTGNGTTAGSIIYGPIGTLTDSLAVELQRGYAVANSDMGHPAATDSARFAYDHPEQLVDFGWRATHELTVKGKAITTAFYGRPPNFSYWYGCSTGGRSALMEAQRFPDDYDGIVAGSPTISHTLADAASLDVRFRVQRDVVNNLSPSKVNLLEQAVLAACDAKDGLVDGLINDPRKCAFDPGALQCPAGQDSNACLTAAQVESARLMYRGLVNPTTGEVVYPGHELGSELQWPTFTVGPVTGPTSWARWVVFRDPNWDGANFDFRNTLDFDAYMANSASVIPLVDATDANMQAFRARGGKLIHYHGWADNNPIAPRQSINYFNSVASYFGQKPDDFYRLFMAPGMTHCFSPLARGPNVFDMITAIEDWVEKGIAPARILASHVTNGVVDRTRPLCSYPDVSRWTGAGSIDDASNFVCTPPMDLVVLPSTLDLRSGPRGVGAFITLGGGFDPAGWSIADVKLEGNPAISLFRRIDGRTYVAKFDAAAVNAVPTGAAVTLSLRGVLEKDGARVDFVTDATIQVLR